MKVKYGTIELPHINYKVIIKPFVKAPEGIENALNYTTHDSEHQCTIYTKKETISADLAHEIVHVLQFIALDRNMDFKLEQEHFGYMMQHIMGKATGHVWK